MADFPDLNLNTTSKDYFDRTIEDLDLNKTYQFQFRWQYEDKTYGEWSASKSITTLGETLLYGPQFRVQDLSGANGFLKITWTGNDSTGAPMTGIKQVNIWIKGGTYGETYVKTAHFFTSAGIKTIAVPVGEYYVKLQAETALGTLSPFSDEQSAWVFKSPKAVTSVTGTWVKDDGTTKTDTLKISFTFDPTFEDNTNSNLYADYFIITLTANSRTRIFYAPVNKAGSSQVFYLSAVQNKANFQLFAKQFSIEIQVRDTNGQTSSVVPQQSLTYVTPLDTPIISVVSGPLSYNVTWNSQGDKPFDQIYIYEDTGSGYVQVAQGLENPIKVSTLNASQRSVKALFYDSNGEATAYSNIVTVSPTPLDPTDTTPPTVPTITAGTVTYNTIPVTISTSDTTTRGYRVRYKRSSDTYYSTFDVGYSGASTSSILINLSPSTVYNIGVAAYDQYNNLSAFSTNINSTTSAQTVSPATSVVLTSGTAGAIASWTAPSSPVTPIDKYKVELYKTGTPDTIITTEFTFSTTISFGGLSAGTYYVKVYSQDIYGVLASSAQSANTSISATGTDGIAPSSSPAPTINPLYGALEIKWTEISNADPVTYEVHVSTTTGFTPSASTKSIEVSGTFAIIKTLPGTSTALSYGTTYYVKLIAKDKDGSAAAGTQASGTPSKVDNGDLAADSVRANVIKAGTITATEIDSSNLLVGKLFAVGNTTDSHAIKINATANTVKLYGGTGVYSDVNTAFYLDTTGKFSLKDRLYFDGNTTLTVNGVINASSGNFAGAMTVDSGAMKFGKDAGGTGNNGIYINANSYWYSTGNLSVGASTGSAALTWNGTTLSVKGAITVDSGTVEGNFRINAGTLTTGASATSGARINVTSAGLFAYDASSTSSSTGLTTQIIGDATSSGFTFKTTKGQLGNWEVDSTTIKNNGLILTAPNAQGAASPGKVSVIGNRGAYYVGMQTPAASAATTDIVLWAGQSADGSAANFRVEAGGTLRASGAVISGDVTISSGTTYNLINSKAKVFRQAAVPTALAQGDIWVDTDDSNKMYVATGAGTGLTTDTPVAGVWALSQDAAAAATAAAAAQSSATTANNRAQKLDSVTGNLIQGLTLTTAGSIYSNKTSYSDTTTGWFLGWYQYQVGSFTPAINIGGSTSYIKYDGYTQTLEVKGNMTAGSITGTTFTTDTAAGGRYISIEGGGASDRIKFYNTGAYGAPGYIAVRSTTNDLDIVPPYTTTITNRITLSSGSNTLIYGGATDAYIRIGSTDAYISKSTTISGTLQVTSGANASSNVKAIKATTTTTTPTGGNDGDIVLVYTN